jgi:exodeoxyribonuclease III
MKIAAWNVNSIKVRLPHVEQWLAYACPDVLVLQETKSMDANFPQAGIEALGYHVVFSGQKTYNGVAILSKKPLVGEVITDFPGFEDVQRRILGVMVDDIFVLNVYVPNGSALDSEKYAYKLKWLHHLQQFMQNQIKKTPKMIVLGDFNIAPEDRDVHDPAEWAGGVLVSPAERDVFRQLLEVGFHDSFRLFEPGGVIYSWWDYRLASFRRGRGLRIDHILISNALKSFCRSSVIDQEPRLWERPSDHAPVLAEFVL